MAFYQGDVFLVEQVDAKLKQITDCSGYIAVKDLCLLFASLGTKEESVRSLLAHVAAHAKRKDAAKTDKIALDDFIGFLFTPRPQEPLGSNTLKMVVIVHRHGARFPNKCLPNDLIWPALPQFWEQYAGMLTPRGSRQLYQLGRQLRARYNELLRGVDMSALPHVIRCHSSPAQRCLFSAMSLLDGMLPDVPRHFTYYNDRQDVDLSEARADMAKKGSSMGISIFIEKFENDKKEDRLFHQIKTASEQAQHFKKNEYRKSPVLKAMDNDLQVLELADKLYRMSGIKKMAPGLDLAERLHGFKSVQTQINIAEAESLPLLPNQAGEILTAEDKLIIERVAHQIWRYWFRPAESDSVADSIGHNAAGYLGHEIARMIDDHMSGRDKQKFVEFSCHDTNVLALAARLGLDVPTPAFAGHFLFELHRPGAKWIVKTLFVPDPTSLTVDQYCTLEGRTVPLHDTYVELETCPVGGCVAEEFVKYLSVPGLTESIKLLRTLTVMSAQIKTGTLTKQSLVKSKAESLTEVRCQELREAFNFFDADNSGHICKNEMISILRRIGEQSLEQSAVENLVDFFDGEGTGQINFNEFVAMTELVSH